MADISSFITELKSKLNIVEVCEKYMTLNQKGGRYWGCCPFHHEKTASFSVSDNGFFYCFGCKESGDIIKFVQQMEGTDFFGALEVLAKMAGMEVPSFSAKNKDEGAEKRKYRDRLQQCLRESAIYYHNNLKSEKATGAKEYMTNRGIDERAMKRFGIGYSMDWDGLVRHLKSRGFSKQEMLDCGVCDQKNGKVYDSLGERLIIPIIDGFKTVVAFGGRVLGKTDFAKYKNTRETEVFSKSRTLYGLNLVKEARKSRKIEDLIVVEGYMDAISLYQAGFDNVVASMGTSLTQEQAKLMKFMVSKVTISYDGDFAGLKAAVRGLDILQSHGIDVKVAVIPDGMDPDDVIKKLGRGAYEKILENALPLVDFKLHILRSETNLEDAIERRKYIQLALSVIAKVRENATKSELCEKLAREVGVKYESIMEDLRRIISGNKEKEIAKEKQEREQNAELAKPRQDEGKNFLLYMILAQKRKIEEIKEVQEIFSPKEKQMMQEFQDMKIPLSSLFEYIGSDAYHVLKYSELEDKDRYFEDVLRRERGKILDKLILRCKSKLSVETNPQARSKLIGEISKYTRMKKM